jgi:hypothetical protein
METYRARWFTENPSHLALLRTYRYEPSRNRFSLVKWHIIWTPHIEALLHTIGGRKHDRTANGQTDPKAGHNPHLPSGSPATSGCRQTAPSRHRTAGNSQRRVREDLPIQDQLRREADQQGK